MPAVVWPGLPARLPVFKHFHRLIGTEADQAEVQNLDLLLPRHHQVLRLDVAVDHSLLMGVLQALSGLMNEIRRVHRRKRAVVSD